MEASRHVVRARTQWRKTRSGFLPRLSGGSSFFGGDVFRHDPLPTMRTSIVFLQPRPNAVAMKPMLTWQYSNLITQLHIIHTDGAFSFAVTTEHLLSNFLGRESFDGGSRSWTGGGRVILRFHELGDDAVEGFFAIDNVAVSGVGGVQDGRKQLVKAGEAGDGRTAVGVSGLVVLLGGVGVRGLGDIFEEGAHDVL